MKVAARSFPLGASCNELSQGEGHIYNTGPIFAHKNVIICHDLKVLTATGANV